VSEFPKPFADEIDIDFPSIALAVDRVRETFAAVDESLAVVREVTLTSRQAFSGAVIPIELGLQRRCGHCAGTGEREHPHHVHLAFPAGVSDGSRFRFVVAPPAVRTTLVEVTISVA
jgi:hypothetical protein